MGKMMSSINDALKKFIENQQLFFVGTAAKDGRVNISPKGMDSLRILDKNKIAWVNLTGSGNETAAHLLDINRMTLMWCAFDEMPLILRVYGMAKAIYRNDEQWNEFASLFPNYRSARQIFLLDVENVQTSCGYGVPHFEFKGQRKRLQEWSDQKSDDEILNYWKAKNAQSIDGFDTGIVLEF